MKRNYLFISASMVILMSAIAILTTGCGGGTDASEKTLAAKPVSLETVAADVESLKKDVASNAKLLTQHDEKFVMQEKWNKAQVATLTALTTKLMGSTAKSAPPAEDPLTSAPPATATLPAEAFPGDTAPATVDSLAVAPLLTSPAETFPSYTPVASVSPIEEELDYLRKLKEAKALREIGRNRKRSISAAELARQNAAAVAGLDERYDDRYATKKDLRGLKKRLEKSLESKIEGCFEKLSKKLAPKSSASASTAPKPPPAAKSTEKTSTLLRRPGPTATAKILCGLSTAR